MNDTTNVISVQVRTHLRTQLLKLGFHRISYTGLRQSVDSSTGAYSELWRKDKDEVELHWQERSINLLVLETYHPKFHTRYFVVDLTQFAVEISDRTIKFTLLCNPNRWQTSGNFDRISSRSTLPPPHSHVEYISIESWMEQGLDVTPVKDWPFQHPQLHSSTTTAGTPADTTSQK